MSKRRVISFLLGFLCLALANGGANAAPSSDPAAFVDDLVHRGLQSLAEKQLAAETRNLKLEQILEADFDLQRIARMLLGHYWNSASAEDRARFTGDFERWLVAAYAQGLKDFNGDMIKVTGAEPLDQGNFVVTSQVTLSSGSPPAKLDWRVLREGDDYKVLDVQFEGISLVVAHRDQFISTMDRDGGISGLMHTLESKTAATP